MFVYLLPKNTIHVECRIDDRIKGTHEQIKNVKPNFPICFFFSLYTCVLYFIYLISLFVLQENLSQALKEFKRDKISKQNARLSLVNSLYENPSMPRRKILLSVGANNYRPPMERSKSAPKLMSIEEAVGEEEDIGSMGQTKRHQTQSVRGSNAWGLSIHRRHFRRNRSAALLPDSENSHISHSPNQWNRSISKFFVFFFVSTRS